MTLLSRRQALIATAALPIAAHPAPPALARAEMQGEAMARSTASSDLAPSR